MLNTIDLDHSAKGVLDLLLNELKTCPHISELQWRQSPSKRGFHIKFQCSKKCIECRKRYDDQLRIYADLTNRKPRERNILWDKKIYFDKDTKKKSVRYAGKWHNVKIVKSKEYKFFVNKKNSKKKTEVSFLARR